VKQTSQTSPSPDQTDGLDLLTWEAEGGRIVVDDDEEVIDYK
jgi:hypothetical protein